MHPAAGTGYEIAGPLEAFNTPIDGKGKELSIIGRQWKIVIQGRNSKVFIDLRFSSNNWLDFQPLKNILIRGSGVGLIEIGIIIRISRCVSQMKVYFRKVLWWLPSRRSVGSAAWHTALEILDAFVVRWLGPAKARYRSVGAGSAG
ncbi:hypothetical protein V6N13_000253 [Hibiscus sabdariffa]